MKENGTFRHKNGFTAVGNTIVRDRRLSFKAKGVYSVIQSYITCPGLVVTKAFLISHGKDGDTSFESGWGELKEKGYLKTHSTPGPDGKMVSEYELLDEPTDGAHTFYYTKTGELSNTNLTRNKNTPKKKRPPRKGGVANGEVAKGQDANRGNNIILKDKTKDNTFYNTQSINQDGVDGIDYFKIDSETVKENIGYDRLAEIYGKEAIDGVVSIMLGALHSRRKSIRIKRDDYPASDVKSRLMELNTCHVEYVLDSMSEAGTKARNIKAYMLTSLYNAPETMELHYMNKVSCDESRGGHAMPGAP